MEIRKLYPDELPPMHLLLLADPSRELVEDIFGEVGTCFVAMDENDNRRVCFVQKDRELIEIMNIAVDEQYHGRGIGKQLIDTCRFAMQGNRDIKRLKSERGIRG